MVSSYQILPSGDNTKVHILQKHKVKDQLTEQTLLHFREYHKVNNKQKKAKTNNDTVKQVETNISMIDKYKNYINKLKINWAEYLHYFYINNFIIDDNINIINDSIKFELYKDELIDYDV